jgi:hypothetical protein
VHGVLLLYSSITEKVNSSATIRMAGTFKGRSGLDKIRADAVWVLGELVG